MHTEQNTTTTQDDSAREAARDLERARQELCSDLVRRNVHLCMSSWVDSLLRSGRGGFNEEAHEHYYGEQSPDWDDVRQACADASVYVVEWMDDDARTFQDADGNPFDLVATGGLDEEEAATLRDDSAARTAGWYVLDGGDLHGCGRVNSFDDCDEATREAADRARVDVQDYIREIYEWWAVDSRFGRKLAERGEHVVDGEHGGAMWGRTCTGQAISMDGVIRRICAETWPEEWSGEKKSGGE